MADNQPEAHRTFDRLVTDVPASVALSEAFWNWQLEAAFTPENVEFSGHLPVLETDNDSLRQIYWWGALGVIWFRRDFQSNFLGRSYDTLMPNYWATTTFLWDFSLSSIVHVLLDPVPMRRQIEHWICSDIHSHFGTSSLTGEGVGRWYSVNDYGMTRLVNDYVRFTGDIGFLQKVLDGYPVWRHLESWANAWTNLRRGSVLADYGAVDNLLECVSTYTHEVASLNAANVWNMRTTAELLEAIGEDGEPLRGSADELVSEVLALYFSGQGHFGARQPDGQIVPVRHCYDFNVVATTIAQDLTEGMTVEMVQFFEEHLQTHNWMRALSPWDLNASFSVRPDHQWTGAYPAWPAEAGKALVALGAEDVVLKWLKGLAETVNEGPPGQAHFVPGLDSACNQGAPKAPPQSPYLIDWACSAAGAWSALVIESIFGVRPYADGRISALPCVAKLDSFAKLRNLRVNDRLFDIGPDGVEGAE